MNFAHLKTNIFIFIIISNVTYNKTSRISVCEISNDKEKVYVGTSDGSLMLYNLETGALKSAKIHNDTVTSITISSDNKHILSTSVDGLLVYWDLNLNKIYQRPKHRVVLKDAAFIPYSNTFVYGGKKEELYLCNTSTGRLQLIIPSNSKTVTNLTYINYKEGVMVIGYNSGLYEIRDVVSLGDIIYSYQDNRALTTIVSEKMYGRLIEGYSDGIIYLRDTGKLKKVTKCKIHTAEITSIDISSDGLYFAAGSKDGTASIWDIARGKRLGVINNNKGKVLGIAFIDLKHLIMVISDNGEMSFYDRNKLDIKYKVIFSENLNIKLINNNAYVYKYQGSIDEIESTYNINKIFDLRDSSDSQKWNLHGEF